MAVKADIILAGIGIGGLRHLTPETLDAVRKARIVLHMTDHHRFLRRQCKSVVDMSNDYWTGEIDEDVYGHLADRILAEATKGPGVVFVNDAHPTIWDDVLWDVWERGRKLGMKMRILPAISSFDAMAAECGLRLDAQGIQIVDATALVAFNQRISPHIDLLIMQIGWFGTFLLHNVRRHRPGRFRPLITYLAKYYSRNHHVRILRAPNSDREQAVVVGTTLGQLDRIRHRVSLDATLHVPRIDEDHSIVNKRLLQLAEDEEYLRKVAVVE